MKYKLTILMLMLGILGMVSFSPAQAESKSQSRSVVAGESHIGWLLSIMINY